MRNELATTIHPMPMVRMGRIRKSQAASRGSMMSKSDEIRPLYRSVTKETVEMAITPIERWEMEVRNPDISPQVIHWDHCRWSSGSLNIDNSDG